MAVTISVKPDAVANNSAWTVTSDKDDATAKAITAYADYSGTVAGAVKVTFGVAHTFLTNDVIVITGSTNYNGTFDFTKIDADEGYIIDTWVADDAAGTGTLSNPNFRIKAELIISAVTEAVKWQPKGSLSFDFKNILWALITGDVIDFDSLNIKTPNSSSYVTYTVKFTEFWENTSNGLVTGANATSGTKYIYEVDVPVASFADYNLSADDEEFLTGRPATNKIKIGDNLVTGWTNGAGANAFDTFIVFGRNITSAIDSSAVNQGICYTNTFGYLSKGDVIEVYCNFTKNSGTLPSIQIRDSGGGGKSNIETFAEGYNYIKLVATADVISAILRITSSTTNQVNFSLKDQHISKGYNELDYLGVISEETTLMGVAAQYDADGTLIRTFGTDGITISGERGVCPISALLFNNRTAVIESILYKVGTGINLNGVELIVGWDTVTDAYDTFTVSGTQITSCIETTGDRGAALQGTAAGGTATEGFSVLKGEVINVACTVTHNGGTLPLIYIVEDSNLNKVISNQVRLSAGANDIDLTATKTVIKQGANGAYIVIDNPAAELVNFSTTGDVLITGTSIQSKGITFERNAVCWKNPVRIEWLNKYGAFDAFTFLDNYNEGRSSKRSTYKDTSDIEQILDIESYQDIETLSNHETKTVLDWIKTILDSKKVYWIVDNVRVEIVVLRISQVKSKNNRVQLSLNFRRIAT